MGEDWYGLLGVEKPTEEGSNEQETAEPEKGANVQETAEPAENENNDGEDTPEEKGENEPETADPGEGEETTPDEMSREERAQNAKRRREKEKQDAIDNALKEERKVTDAKIAKHQDDFIRKLRLTNPFTKKPVTNVTEYEEYVMERDRKAADEGLKRAGLDRETITTIIDEHPDIQRARQIANEAEKTQQLTEQQRIEQHREKTLSELTKLDPDIKSFEDLRSQENYQQIYEKVNAGYSLIDAYKLCNEEKLNKRRENAIRQEAINSSRGKGHMQTTTPHSETGGLTVPAAVKRQYEQFYPGITDAEIKAKYEKAVKVSKRG